MCIQAEWRELETNGYVFVRSFFSDGEISTLREDFAKGAPPDSYPHGFKLVGRRALESVWKKLAEASAEIRAQTFLQIDIMPFLTFSHYVITERTERTSYWHQDFDFDYKMTLDHINYLNFYVPIVKPEVGRSNVCVIPYDALKAKSSEAFDRLRGSGGHRLVPKNGRTVVYGNYGGVIDPNDERNSLFTLDFDIDELAVTPDLAVGDLLLMRGDIVHRTQDASTQRTAASLRVTSSKKIIKRERVGAHKANDPSAQLEDLLLRCLDSAGKDQITLGEFLSFANGTRAPSVTTP